MMWVAIRMLVGDRLKYMGLVAGLAFAALLITQQASILAGMTAQTGAFINDAGQADLWVMDPQVQFSEDAKYMPETALNRVRGIEGVLWAVPLYKGWLKCRLPDGTLITCILVGIDDATLVGAPPEMVEGRLQDLQRDRAVFIEARDADSKFAMSRGLPAGEKRPLRLGDAIAINDHEAIVTGTCRLSKSFFWDPVVYTTYSRALSFAPPERKLLSFVLAKVKPGFDRDEVARRIRAATGLEARSGDEFRAVTARFILEKTGILVNFGLAVGLGFIIGMLVAAQMLYNFTLDNLRHFAALKAMGASNFTITRMLGVQVLAAGTIGYGLGVGIASAMGQVIVRTGLAFLMPWQIPLLTAAALMLICCFAGAMSLIRVVRLEPAIVFKS